MVVLENNLLCTSLIGDKSLKLICTPIEVDVAIIDYKTFLGRSFLLDPSCMNVKITQAKALLYTVNILVCALYLLTQST